MAKICVWGTSLKKMRDEARLLAFSRIAKRRIPRLHITTISRYGERMTEMLN